MADPILDAHRLLPQLYLLGSPLSPISIRDQILRARWVVDRLVRSDEVREGMRILIVGAGAAGATAAIRAAQHGAVEQSGGAFGVESLELVRAPRSRVLPGDAVARHHHEPVVQLPILEFPQIRAVPPIGAVRIERAIFKAWENRQTQTVIGLFEKASQ